MKKSIRLSLISATLVPTFLLSSCNMFKPFSSPGGDEQLMSAARACLDRGDSACALENYQKISADNADIAASEEAYLTLDQYGFTMADFMEFVGNGAQGPAITKLANKMASTDASKERRLGLHGAFKKKSDITKDVQLKAFVEFLSSLALMSEILAEGTGADKTLQKTDLVTDPSACVAAGNTCLIAAACDAPGGSAFQTTVSADIETTAPASTQPTLDQLYWAISHTYSSLSDLRAGGNFGGASTGLNAIFAAGRPSDGAPQARCFRQQLLIFQIGG